MWNHDLQPQKLLYLQYLNAFGHQTQWLITKKLRNQNQYDSPTTVAMITNLGIMMT